MAEPVFRDRNAKPIKETEWTRVYRAGDAFVHVSKFLEGGLQVSADSIRARWPTFSFQEKLDFAQAFSAGGKATAEDERILDFLMEAGDFHIWDAIALRLRHHRDKDRVLAFLLERIKEKGEYKANFFQAIGLMKNERAVRALRAAYDDYRKRLGASLSSGASLDYMDYLYCCAALWRIEGPSEYKQVIEDASRSQDEAVRITAELILRDL